MQDPTSNSQASAAGHSLPELRIKVRIGDTVIGPGKVRLLSLIEETGGISAAARDMGMTYRRAWHLVSTLNDALGQAVVETEVGGRGGGGAKLTDLGRELVRRYTAAAHSAAAEMHPLLQWLDDR